MTIPVIIDTDIGSDIDDAYALVFASCCPELSITAVLTNSGDAKQKARIAHAFLPNTPIFAGLSKTKSPQTTTITSPYDPPSLQDALALLTRDLTYICIGALSNLAYVLSKGYTFQRIIIMGGSLGTDYDGRKHRIPEWNLKGDLDASRQVFSTQHPITLIPLDATWNITLNEEQLARLATASPLLNQHLKEMRDYLKERYKITKQPVLHDPLAIINAFNDQYNTYEQRKLFVSNKGILEDEGNTITVAMTTRPAFVTFFMERVTGQHLQNHTPQQR